MFLGFVSSFASVFGAPSTLPVTSGAPSTLGAPSIFGELARGIPSGSCAKTALSASVRGILAAFFCATRCKFVFC